MEGKQKLVIGVAIVVFVVAMYVSYKASRRENMVKIDNIDMILTSQKQLRVLRETQARLDAYLRQLRDGNMTVANELYVLLNEPSVKDFNGLIDEALTQEYMLQQQIAVLQTYNDLVAKHSLVI